MTQGENRMAVKLFILGLPGSGKSTVARYITTYVRDRQWSTNHINDYAILYRMFQEDTEGKQFKPAGHGGFDVHDLTVFDTALQRLERQVSPYFSSPKSDEIILIEFSRKDYQKAFRQFSSAFLQGAYFLYLTVDIKTCKRRIRERIAHPLTPDDHFVSDYIFREYYNEDNGQDIPHILEGAFVIDKQRAMVINNSGSLKEASPKINSFVDFIIARASSHIGTAIVPRSQLVYLGNPI